MYNAALIGKASDSFMCANINSAPSLLSIYLSSPYSPLFSSSNVFYELISPFFLLKCWLPFSEFLHVCAFLTLPPFCFPLFSFGFKADSWQQHAFGHPSRGPTGQHKSWGSALLSINGLQAQRWRSRVSTAYWAPHQRPGPSLCVPAFIQLNTPILGAMF